MPVKGGGRGKFEFRIINKAHVLDQMPIDDLEYDLENHAKAEKYTTRVKDTFLLSVLRRVKECEAVMRRLIQTDVGDIREITEINQACQDYFQRHPGR